MGSRESVLPQGQAALELVKGPVTLYGHVPSEVMGPFQLSPEDLTAEHQDSDGVGELQLSNVLNELCKACMPTRWRCLPMLNKSRLQWDCMQLLLARR